MRTFLYARVSTAEQTAAHQEAQARKAGFQIDEVITDEGVSGVSTAMRERPGGKRLLDKLRKGDVVIVRWLDRLGRNYADVTATLRALLSQGITVRTVINNMTFDANPPDVMQEAIRDALIGFMAAQSQAQVEATKEALRAGVAHAKEHGSRAHREHGETNLAYLGRKPAFTREQMDTALTMDSTVSEIARATGLKRQTVYRIKADPAKAEASLKAWGL